MASAALRSIKTCTLWTGHWVEPVSAERVAARKTFRASPGAGQEAVHANRLCHVVGAGRLEAAASCEERRDQHFIRAQQGERGDHREAAVVRFVHRADPVG